MNSTLRATLSDLKNESYYVQSQSIIVQRDIDIAEYKKHFSISKLGNRNRN